ncbi:MAG: hypothetical protein KatS3mg020_0033 [Fimbriimonadales bacterium]|nr:MAG: hypothetical protein KatS3mg020_0033 [Fimbriimonadales bacterium]
MRRQMLRWVRRKLAHRRAKQLFAGVLTVALTLPPQFGFAAELHYVRGGLSVLRILTLPGFLEDCDQCEGTWELRGQNCRDGTQSVLVSSCSDSNRSCDRSKPFRCDGQGCIAKGSVSVIGNPCNSDRWPPEYRELGRQPRDIYFCPVIEIPPYTAVMVLTATLCTRVCDVTLVCSADGRIMWRSREEPYSVCKFVVQYIPLSGCCPNEVPGSIRIILL